MNPEPTKKTTKKRYKLLFFMSALLIFLLYVSYFYLKPYYQFIYEITGVNPIKLVLSGEDFKNDNGVVNFLLLGKAGGNHDGPNLTDAITIVSYNFKKKQITSISLPRDIWSDTLKDRINSAYAYGEISKKGGIALAKTEVSKIVGIPLHYGILIDFEKFKELIDFLGGIDINIDQTFDDYKYPIPGLENDLCGLNARQATGNAKFDCRYEHLSFKKGHTHMNGSLALKFARSRNAIGTEGSDYARGRRQQKIIYAIYLRLANKLKKPDLADLRKTYQLLDKIIVRDIANTQSAYIARDYVLGGTTMINQTALSSDFFEVPAKRDYFGKYVLIPIDGDFSQIHGYIKCLIEGQSHCVSENKRDNNQK